MLVPRESKAHNCEGMGNMAATKLLVFLCMPVPSIKPQCKGTSIDTGCSLSALDPAKLHCSDPAFVPALAKCHGTVDLRAHITLRMSQTAGFLLDT